jgi:hypothetical protein
MRCRSPQFAVAVCAAVLCSCAAETPVVDLKGECGGAFGSDVCAFARVQGENVVEVGTTFSLATIEGAPAQMDMPMQMPPTPVVALALPEATVAKAGFTEFTFFWENEGHPPAPFMTPHFDFHFYLIPQAERMAIDCRDVAKPAELPAGYALPDEKLPPDLAKMLGTDVLVGVCVPQMGMHALPAADLEGTTPFRGNMVIGYYKTKPIFIEPMISRAMLLEKKSFELPIPAVPGLTGPHPTTFRADYDEQAQTYRFVFTNFTTG